MRVQFSRPYIGVFEFNVASFGLVNGIYSVAPVYLTGTVNFGMAPSHRITQRGPFQEGDSDIDFRLDPRIISLPIVVPTSSIDEHFRQRNLLLDIFKPGNDPATLIVTYDDT